MFFSCFSLISFGFSKELEQTKNRRGGGGTSGLFAFPRVGRSDPSLSNLHNTDAASDNAAAAAAAALDVLYPSSSFEEYEGLYFIFSL